MDLVQPYTEMGQKTVTYQYFEMQTHMHTDTDYSLQAKSSREHFLDGIQRLDEPVSKITVNVCGGVPMVMSP